MWEFTNYRVIEQEEGRGEGGQRRVLQRPSGTAGNLQQQLLAVERRRWHNFSSEIVKGWIIFQHHLQVPSIFFPLFVSCARIQASIHPLYDMQETQYITMGVCVVVLAFLTKTSIFKCEKGSPSFHLSYIWCLRAFYPILQITLLQSTFRSMP